MLDLTEKQANRELFGRTLQMARTQMGKTRKCMAETMGINENSINKWENGHNFPTKEKLEKIAEVYRLEQADLEVCFEISKNAKGVLSDGNRKSRRDYTIHNPYAPIETGRSGRIKGHWPDDHVDYSR